MVGGRHAAVTFSLTHSPTLSLSLSHTHTLTHSLTFTHSLPHALILSLTQQGGTSGKSSVAASTVLVGQELLAEVFGESWSAKTQVEALNPELFKP